MVYYLHRTDFVQEKPLSDLVPTPQSTESDGALQLTPALSRDDVYKTLSTRPLLEPAEFQAFYRQELNAVRGGDKVSYMARHLNRMFHAGFYKTFLMGHSGVGKSTELTRLCQIVSDKYSVIRFSAQTDLDAGGFRPFDVLLILMIRLTEEVSKPTEEGGAGTEPPDDLAEDILRWFAIEKNTTAEVSGDSINAAAGIKPSWAALLGLFAEIKGEIKYTADRKREVTEYRINSLSTLIDLINRLLDACNAVLRRNAQREWLFIGEDFDKPGIPTSLTESLFLEYANVFSNLKTHLIFDIPIALAYSDKAAQLSLSQICIPDTPMFNRNHQPDEAGRDAVSEVLLARVSPDLFEEGQMLRLVIASGGNLRELFEMTAFAADSAAIRTNSQGKIGAVDATLAINDKRTQHLRSLGTGPYDAHTIGYEEKAERLIAVYHQQPGYDVPDVALHSLLRARAVQEFNGERWFGVHPLVVDILKRQGKLTLSTGGAVTGGSD